MWASNYPSAGHLHPIKYLQFFPSESTQHVSSMFDPWHLLKMCCFLVSQYAPLGWTDQPSTRTLKGVTGSHVQLFPAVAFFCRSKSRKCCTSKSTGSSCGSSCLGSKEMDIERHKPFWEKWSLSMSHPGCLISILISWCMIHNRHITV